VSSYGEAAVELARLAGLVLDPWQRDSLELMLAVRADGKWACFEFAEIVARQNGKGSILEARALAGLFLLGEQLIMWSAHEVKTALEAFRRLRALLVNLGESVNENLIDVDGVLVKVSNTNGQESLERLDTGQRVKFIARSKGSGRGFSGDVNIVDEAFAYTDDQHAALLPTMSARPNPQLIYTSSPPLTDDTGEVLFRLRKRAEVGKAVRLGFRDWGAPGTLDDLSALNLDDRELWAVTNPAYGIRIDEEFIQSERESMSDEKFAVERLGVWPKQRVGGGAIDPAQWASLFDPDSRRDGDIALGVDIAPQRDYASIALYGRRVDEIGHGQLVDYRAGTDWIVPRLVDLRDALDPVAFGMGRGTAASLKTGLEQVGITRPADEDKPTRGDVMVMAGVDMAAACGQLIDAVRQGALRHVGQKPLDAAVSGAKTKEAGDTIAWSRKDADTEVSPLVALTVAKRAYLERVGKVNRPGVEPMVVWR
jgi:phage terminase large subunit-like protein